MLQLYYSNGKIDETQSDSLLHLQCKKKSDNTNRCRYKHNPSTDTLCGCELRDQLVDNGFHLSEAHHLITSGCVSVPPTLLGSDDVRTLTVPVNGHLTLECLADSDPPPNIEWYKDETKLQVQHRGGGAGIYLQDNLVTLSHTLFLLLLLN